MLKVYLGVAALCALGLGACGGGSSERAQSSTSDSADEGVFDPLVDTLDRAESVEDVGLERKDSLDDRLEELN